MFDTVGAAEITLLLVIIGIFLIPVILYLLTLQKAIERCSVESRTISPASVWLVLIPLFNIVWQFIMVIRISETLNNEFTKRNIPEDPQPGKTIGLAYCILGLCGFIPIIGIFTSIAALVCWIVYWVKIAGYSNKLEQPVLAQAG
jgi:hypothetical protein